MTKLLKLIFNPWTLAILGLVAIALVIWFAGPLFAFADRRPLESTNARWLLIVVVVVVWLGRLAWRAVKAHLANARLMEGLKRQPVQAQPGNAAAAEEVAALTKRFAEATAALKESSARKGWRSLLAPRRYLYDLPWYVIIGAPGSGKTTALVHSGLQFPLADRFGQGSAKVRGIGGTRNCDWWFTDEAVLLDTAGRYSTQETNRDVDSAAWLGFLGLLRKYRPRRPINGVIVTVSARDLLELSAAEAEEQASRLRTRIEELHKELNIRFPIYVWVTKVDLLPGFSEYFGELGRDERAQVWGYTDPMREGTQPLADFGEQFDRLAGRLMQGTLDRMQQERDAQRRPLVYLFPQQFAALKGALTDFLTTALAPTQYHQSPLVRGVYFTSGTQEGTPIDRILGAMLRSRSLGARSLPTNVPTGKSYFITRLLRDVMFSEAGLAGTNLKWERRRALLEWGGLACLLLVGGGVALAWSVSYARNKSYLSEIEGKLPEVAQLVTRARDAGGTDILTMLPVLRSVRELPSTPGVSADDPPMSMGFGLFQGRKLAAASDRAYRGLLEDAFLPRVENRLVQWVRSQGGQIQELPYEGLKAYLMMHHREHFNADDIKEFVGMEWDANLPRDVPGPDRKALQEHLAYALTQEDHVPSGRDDARFVEETRQSLARTSIAQRAYGRLKRQGVGTKIAPFTMAGAAGPNVNLVFTRVSGKPLTEGVPGLYRYEAYYGPFGNAVESVAKQLASEQAWVLGIDPASADRGAQGVAQVDSQVRRLYLEDYASTWERFVADIRLVRPGSLQQNIQLARLLSAPETPLPVLFRAIVKEVTLVKVAPEDKDLVDKGKDLLSKGTAQARGALKKIVGDSDARPEPGAEMRIERIVDDRFDALRRYVTAPVPGQPAPVDALVPLMNEFYNYMLALDAAKAAGIVPPHSDVPMKMQAESQRLPEPLRAMISGLTKGGSAHGVSTTQTVVKQAVRAALGNFCTEAIAKRYPFDKEGTRGDVTQDDFAHLFAPDGVLDEAFKKNLAALVDTSMRPWSYRKTDGGQPVDDTGMLVQFQRAAAIRDVFFPGGAKAPTFRLTVSPVEMDAAISQFVLDIDGQTLKYSHGPQIPLNVVWPGPAGTKQVRYQTIGSPGSAPIVKVFDGPWALFHMLDRSKVETTGQPEKFFVTLDVDGHKTKLQVTTGSVQNPFQFGDLQRFRCPA